MHQRKQWQRVWAAAVAAAMAVPTAGVAAEKPESDDPNARRRAMDAYYNESSERGRERHAKGGPFSPGYQRFLNEAARVEREKYRSLLPGTASSIGATGAATAGAELAATGSTWVNIGPTKANYAQNGGYSLNETDSGRVRNILVDPSSPSTLYVAFSGGGVWKSTDGGASWTPKTETLGSLSVGALEMDPASSQTLYLGLGDPFDGTGIGFLKSTDGGNTWMNPVYLGASSVITDIEVVRGAPGTLLVSTNAGLFRSVDGGASFSAVALETGVAATPYAWSIAHAGGSTYVASVEADPANANGATNGQLFRSTDAGATWARVPGISVRRVDLARMTVAAAPSQPATLYALASNAGGDLAEIFKSTNAGATWTALGAAGKRYKNGNSEARSLSALFNTQGWYDQMLIVHPSAPGTLYVGGALHMARSTDGGATWYQVSNWLGQFGLPYVHADFHAAAFDANGTLYVGSDGGIFKTTDNAASFSSALNVGIASHLLYDLGSSGANRSAVIAGLQDNGTRVRVGSTGVYNQEIGGDGFDCDVNAADASKLLGTLYYARIYRSTNGGLDFAAASTGIAESNNSSSAPFITRLTRWEGDPTGNTLYTYSNTKVYKTTNYATSWSALGVTGLPSGIFIRNVGAAKSNGSVVGLVASGGRAFLSTNGGASWTQTGALPNNGLSLSDIAFDPANASVVFVTSVAPDATKAHVWKSTDGGATFAVSEAGLPAGVPVNTVVVDPGSSSTVYAGTHLGVYRSVDGGATWARFGAGMPLVNVTDVEVLPDSSLVRAATFGRSAWELAP